MRVVNLGVALGLNILLIDRRSLTSLHMLVAGKSCDAESTDNLFSLWHLWRQHWC